MDMSVRGRQDLPRMVHSDGNFYLFLSSAGVVLSSFLLLFLRSATKGFLSLFFGNGPFLPFFLVIQEWHFSFPFSNDTFPSFRHEGDKYKHLFVGFSFDEDDHSFR